MLSVVRRVSRAAAALALLGCVAEAQAQTASINGYIRDAESGETLIGANAFVVGGPTSGRGAASNTQGFYTLGGLEAGTYTVRYSFTGYERETREVSVEPGQTARVDVELAPEGSLGEVVVEAEVPLEEERAVGLQEVSIDLVEALPTVFEADLFRSVQLLPGVKASSDFSSALYIRGGSPDQTLILLDGTTVYNPTHFFGFFSTFNTDAIKDVNLYKGAYPSTYGGRLGSVIDIYNKDGNRNRVAGSVTGGILASRAGVEGPLPGGRGSFAFNARRSTLEPLLAVLREQLDEEGIPESFYFYDLNAKVGVDVTQNDRVSVAAYAGRDQVVVPFGEDAQFDLDYGNRTVSASYNRILSGTAFAQTRLTASRYFSRPEGSIAGTSFTRPNTITDYSARFDLEWLPSEALEVRTGVWGGRFDLELSSAFNDNTQTQFRNLSPYASGYVQTKLRPTPEWIVTGGLRAEYFQSGTDDELDNDPAVQTDYVRVSPQLQVERLIGDDIVVQAAAGQYHQFLSLISSEAFSGFDTWLTTGAGVAPQRSEQAVLGVKTKLGDSYRLDVEVYGRTLRELFDTRPELQDVAGLSYAELFRFGEGYAYGTEVLLEKGVGRLTGLLSYTLGITRRRYPAEPSFTEFFPPKYDRLHDLTAVANVDLGKGWTFTTAGTYATGQAYTTPQGRGTVRIPFEDPTLPILVTDRLNGSRLPPYHRVDVGFTRNGSLFGLDSELQLQIVNVYNRRNLWFVTFDTSDNPYTVNEVRQLPILPNVSLTVDF